MIKEDISISIIIPHKNSSLLLTRLLSSIKTTISYQVIVIDDNSNDREFSMIQKMQRQYNFELYKNDGLFAGGARNTGLKYAKGKWVLFADSDDFYLPTFSDILKRHINSNADLIICNVSSCDSETLEPAERSRYINMMFNEALSDGNINELRCKFLAPWSKIIRRSLIVNNNIRFDEIPAGNDMWFSIQIAVKAKEIVLEKEQLYCVTISSGSITTTFSKEKFKSRFLATLKINDYIRLNGYEKYQSSILYYIGKAISLGFNELFFVLIQCYKHHSNLFIGASNFLRLNRTIKKRQNKYTKNE